MWDDPNIDYHGWFTERFGTAYPREAMALLNELSRPLRLRDCAL